MLTNKSKKAVTIQSTIIGLIILLISAGILFYIFKLLPFSDIIDKETCHNSVLLRSNWIAKELPEGSKPPLKCKTEQITIKQTDEKKIKQQVANAMFDCWFMLGEGKLNFFGEGDLQNSVLSKFGLKRGEAACVLCSVIGFDKNVQSRVKNVKNFEDYLEKTKIKGKDFSYLEYLTNQEGAELAVEARVESNFATDKDYAVLFMRIKGSSPQEIASTIEKTVVGVGGISAYTFRGLLLSAPKVFLRRVGVFVLLPFAAGQAGYGVAAIHAAAEKCETGEGCSGLFFVPYEAQGLGKLCENLQSIP